MAYLNCLWNFHVLSSNGLPREQSASEQVAGDVCVWRGVRGKGFHSQQSSVMSSVTAGRQEVAEPSGSWQSISSQCALML